MFTKWYKSIQMARIALSIEKDMYAYDGTSYTYYGDNRASRSTYELSLGYALNRALEPARFENSGFPCVWFGSGTTPPTAEDYALECWLENVTCTPGTLQKTYRDNQGRFANTFMITNDGTEEITVSEVGIFAPASSTSNISLSTKYTMLERTVFAPVTIKPGASASVKYEIVVNYPTA